MISHKPYEIQGDDDPLGHHHREWLHGVQWCACAGRSDDICASGACVLFELALF